MTTDSLRHPSPNEEPSPSTSPSQHLDWGVWLFLLGVVYLLAGMNVEFQEVFGKALAGWMKLIGLGIVVWFCISRKRSKPMRVRALFVFAIPLIVLVVLAFFEIPRMYVRHGNQYAKRGDFEKAIDEFTKAVQWNSTLAAAYYNRGNAHMSRNNTDEAIADYTKAIEIDPRDEKYYSNRGAAYLAKEDYLNAVGDFTEAIRLNGQLANAYFGRGLAYAELGDTPWSETDLAKARELDPKFDQNQLSQDN